MLFLYFLHFISGDIQWRYEKGKCNIADRVCSLRIFISTAVANPLVPGIPGIYLITIVGSLGLIALIWNDSQLHTRMYLFLGSLAFVYTSVSSIVTPKMLVNFFAKSKMIILSECMVQFFPFTVSATAECFLLASMAYDRYVAICNPLFIQWLWPIDYVCDC